MHFSRARFLLSTTAFLAAAWLTLWLAGPALAQGIASLLGDTLLRAGEGKFTDPAVFVLGRLREALLFATLAGLLAAAVGSLHSLGQRFQFYRRARGVWLGVVIFISLNVWCLLANQTALSWCFFYDRIYVDNYAQYQIKKYLIREQSAAHKVILVGNSASNSNINETLLNRTLAPAVWTTDMHQPGAVGFDSLLLLRDLGATDSDLLVAYLSVGYFYGQPGGEVAVNFMRWRDLPELLRWDGWSFYPEGAVRSGLLGQLLPIFRHHKSFTQRLLGGALIYLRPRVPDVLPTADPLIKIAGGFRRGPAAEFHKGAFRHAMAELASRRLPIVLIVGEMNPLIEKHVDSEVKQEFREYLDSLQLAFPGIVTLVPQAAFFSLQSEDFADHIHFTRATQARMTAKLAELLPGLLRPAFSPL